MTPAARQIVFINTAHTITHYSLLILPTAVLAMAIPGGPFGESYGPILALATGMFVLYGLLSLPQGWLVQRFGRKALMTAFFLGTGGGLIAAGFAHSPAILAAALACAGGFAAIYHPIGTTMLVEAAGDKPGRAIGMNGVFGNLGVALAPVVTAFLANAVGWRAAFIAPGLFCAIAGMLWIRTPLAPASTHINRRPFPPIPRHLVRRAVLVLMLIATSSGLVFNAFTLLLPKLMQERLAENATLLPLVGAAAFLVDAMRRAHPVQRRPDDRSQHAEEGVPAGQHRAGAGNAGTVIRTGLAGAAAGRRRRGIDLRPGHGERDDGCPLHLP